MPYRRLMILLIPLLLGFDASAQPSQLQIGLGGWPGAGAQFVYVESYSVHSVEVLASFDSELWKSRTPFYLSAGVGAALRPLGILRVIGRADYQYDFYIGIRFGPALHFLQRPTHAEKNRQFSLFLDPFLRYTQPYQDLTLFFELGMQRPITRFGVWFSLQN
ncbi:MAG: hypothetical protein OXF08_09965 [Bacteroidetes bacterium]|nr:hypothetical protein [Bacteroidota bacterium]